MVDRVGRWWRRLMPWYRDDRWRYDTYDFPPDEPPGS